MKALKKTVFAFAAALMTTAFVACSDANEYEDTNTVNPSWTGQQYNDSLKIAHPESVAGTYWVRGAGLKVNAYGEEVQGYVESLEFVDEASVVVKMSQASNLPSSISATAVWKDDSNNASTPTYEYTYTATSGSLEILKTTTDDKGKVSKSAIFTANVVEGNKGTVLTVVHYGDTPVQTYLVQTTKPVIEETPAADAETPADDVVTPAE